MTRALPETVAAALRDSDARLVLTGAGGWLGLATLELLAETLGPSFTSRVVAFGSARRTLRLRDGTAIDQRPLEEIVALRPQATLVLHTAFLTKDKVAGMSEQAYVAANRRISDTMFGALDAIGADGLFLASSGAAGFADDPAAAPDLRLYGRLKRDDEERAAVWAAERSGTAAIARIFSLTGPYINKPHNYALASFLLDALAGRPIEVRAATRVVRSYAAIRDLVALSLSLLLRRADAITRFETGGVPMEMGEIAAAVSVVTGGPGFVRAPLGEGEDNIYAGDDRQWHSLLAGEGLAPTPFAEQLRETADYLAALDRVRPEPGVGASRSRTQVNHA
ncbi:NAD-dependent epimerase/dehydratase family protein [Sphingomonas ginkgonis]|uniref:NAD-dependent epimerase/dehydratase family protein n=1 Tax=Sphingomonas ginkgonis TaxID=2315330 RepID=UPI00163AE9BA|nr:NAD-dependent epimerase/dehydratase family protein [Sphingomonas ginkgonis]